MNNWMTQYSLNVDDLMKRIFDEVDDFDKKIGSQDPKDTFFHDLTHPFQKDYNLIKKEDRFIYEFSLPKFKKDEVNISFDENKNVLTVTAYRNTEQDPAYLASNMRTSLEKEFKFRNCTVQVDQIDAELADGVLTVEVPFKKQREKNSVKRIDIK